VRKDTPNPSSPAAVSGGSITARWIPAFAGMTVLILGLIRSSPAAEEAYYDYLRGLVEERSGHMAKAQAAYEQAVRKDPKALQVYRDLAELHLRMGKPEEALQAAEHVRDLAPQDPSSFLFLGNVLVAQGNLAKAAEAYEKSLQLDPQNLRALENLGNYYSIVDPDKALSYYQRYLEIHPRDPDIHFQVGLLYQKKGDREKAMSFYKQAVDLDPQELPAHLAMAELYEEQNSTAAAIAEYQVAAALQSANPLIALRLGNLYYRAQQWEDAWHAFKSVEALSPQEPSVYYWLARVAEERKNFKEAAEYSEKAFNVGKDPQFLPLTAYYLTIDHQVESAVKWLEKARQADPQNANVLLFMGMDYLELGKLEKASEALSKGVELFPKDAQMHFQMGMVQDRLGHFDEAVKEFETVLSLDAINSAAMNYLGYSWADRGMKLEEAEKLLRQAVSLAPDNGAYLDSLGWVRYKRGDFKEARDWLVKAIFYSPDPLIYDHLGDAFWGEGHPEAALQAWTKGLSLDPKNEVLRKKIQEKGALFLGPEGSKKYFTYLEGNVRQAQNLRSDVRVRGRLNRKPLQAEGKLYYRQPDCVLLDVPKSGKTGAVRFLIQGTTRQVEPAASSPILAQVALEGLASIQQFLSGNLTSTLQVRLDARTGMLTSFSRPNPSGGQDVVEVISFDFVEGVWLPSEIQVRNRTIGWEARLQFSDWSINLQEKDLPFQ
jgi:tetratricopeptide (TPR) repeat protein